jgi:hypothetical protein
MGEKWNTWEIWGKIGILAKNLGKIGILAKNLGKIGILTKNLGKSGILAKKLGKIGLLGKIWEKMWFLEYILIFFSIVLPLGPLNTIAEKYGKKPRRNPTGAINRFDAKSSFHSYLVLYILHILFTLQIAQDKVNFFIFIRCSSDQWTTRP